WDVSLSNYVSEQVAQGKKLNYSYRLPYEQKHLRFRDIKKSDKQSFIFFDSKIEMDRIFIESQILPFLRNANTLVLDHGSHYLLTFLQKLGVLKQFVTSIVENDCFMSMVDVDFESSSIWNFQKGEWMIREANDYISGAAYLKKAVNIDQHKLAKDLLDVIAES
ncbi:MAG: hypothetical protein VXY56_05895, partial [Pseudomonadota bacterium]|nr:hypothetical protein [Pseudomonadota bacterium]